MRYFLKLALFLLILAPFTSPAYSQTLITNYPFPNVNVFNGFWGITEINDTLYIGSDYTGNIYKVTKTGVILDTIDLPPSIDFNHGLVWDGTGFWTAEDFRTAGARIYKVNMAGAIVDSILTGTYAGGIGGLARDGNNLWFTVYSPDNTSYPNAFAYKVSLATKLLVDTIPLRGRQVNGIAIKGDTVLYVNELFHTTPTVDPERIYAYRDAAGDTLFSFPGPDPDGDDNPKGLYWDGQFLWMIAERIGGTANVFKALYKYSLSGGGNPIISTSSNTINFPNTIVSQTSNQNLTITNTGTAKLIISAFNINNPRFGISPNAVPDTLNPSQSKIYSVSFSPLTFGNDSAQISIASNDGGTPVKIVKLYGKGVNNGPAISLSSNFFDYQQRRVNSMCGFTFAVSNNGSAPLNITSMTFTGTRYRLDTTGVTFPAVVDTQRTRLFRVWFNPNSAATFADSLTIQSNSATSSTIRIRLTGTGVSSATTLGDIMWEGTTPDNPGTTSDDFQPKSIKETGDINGDGVHDVLIASSNYWLICYNGNSSVTADTLWKFNLDFGNLTNPPIAEESMQIGEDVDGDGIMDVFLGGGGGLDDVYCISGRTGKLIWQYAGSGQGDASYLRVDKDFNGDGRKDVLVSATGNGEGQGRHAVICINGLNGQQIFLTTQTSQFTYDVLATESGGAIGTSNNGGPYGVSGYNNSGQNAWSYGLTGALWNMREIPDINNDNGKDIVGLNGFNGAIFAITGDAGAEIWTQSLGFSSEGKIVLLDDVNNNGAIDMAISGIQNSISRVDTKTGNTIWSAPLGNSYVRGVDKIGDVSGDTIGEIAVITQQPSKVYVLNGLTGAVMFEYQFGTSLNQRGDRVAGLKSIDGNLSWEFVTGIRDGRIVCFSGGPNATVNIDPVSNIIPEKFDLKQNYPNPFNPVTSIKFDIPKLTKVKLTVYDALGREIANLVNSELSAGVYEYDFNGAALASGVYFYRLETPDFTSVKKMTLVK